MAEIMVRFDDLRRYCENRHCGRVPIEYIKQMPTIESEPVRRGRWTDNGEDKFICSACKGYVYRWFGKSDFCPRCGADMRDGGADNA